VHVRGRALAAERVAVVRERLTAVMRQAARRAPAIVLLDDVDEVCIYMYMCVCASG
jgi:AAA+ superfamily predicted ATPase